MAVYTRYLTPGEVTGHYQRALNAPAGRSVHYWHDGRTQVDPAAALVGADVQAPDGSDLLHDQQDPVSGSFATSYLYYNGHGDLAAETDAATTPLQTYSYDPFGIPQQDTAHNNSDVASQGSSERFTAAYDKKTDQSTALVEMGARAYDPTLGRFYSTDPIEGGSLSNYDYAAQDPVNAYDLSGTVVCGHDGCGGGVGGGVAPRGPKGAPIVVGRVPLDKLIERLRFDQNDVAVIPGGPGALRRLFRDLVRGGKEVFPPRYAGRMFEVANGIRVGLRTSRQHRLTIDVGGVPGLPASFRIHHGT